MSDRVRRHLKSGRRYVVSPCLRTGSQDRGRGPSIAPGPYRAFAFQDNLRDVGLTSLDMTNLVLSVEAEFAIRIPERGITPANFTSVATIGRLVASLSSADDATGG